VTFSHADGTFVHLPLPATCVYMTDELIAGMAKL